MSYLGQKFNREPWETAFEYHVAARSRARKREKQLKKLAAGKSLRDDLVETVDIRPVRITEEGFNWYLDLVRNVVRQIEQEIWTPRPGTWACSESWCGYWDMCRGKTMPKSFLVEEEVVELVPLGSG